MYLLNAQRKFYTRATPFVCLFFWRFFLFSSSLRRSYARATVMNSIWSAEETRLRGSMWYQFSTRRRWMWMKKCQFAMTFRLRTRREENSHPPMAEVVAVFFISCGEEWTSSRRRTRTEILLIIFVIGSRVIVVLHRQVRFDRSPVHVFRAAVKFPADWIQGQW